MFWERFRTLCTEAGKTPNAVARELGLSSATTSQWKRRDEENGDGGKDGPARDGGGRTDPG